MCSTPDILYVSKELKTAGEGVGNFNLKVLAAHHIRKHVHKCTYVRTQTEREISRVSRTSDMQATRAWVKNLWLHRSW